jgi:hypothetical protein
MDVVFRLLSELRLVLVAVALVCCAAFLFTGFASWRELRRVVFKLERSTLIANALSAWFRAAICAAIGLAVWLVTSDDVSRSGADLRDNPLAAAPTPMLVRNEPTPLPTADLSSLALVALPTAPAEAALAIPATPPAAAPTLPPLPSDTPLPLPSPLPTQPLLPLSPPSPLPTQSPPQAQLPNVVMATETPTPELIPLLPQFSPTPQPAVSELMIADCPYPAARIVSPVAGETVTGIYVVRGTAEFPGGLGRYKIEILRPNVPGWAFLWENYNAVRDGVLMPRFDAGLFSPGIYTLRLSLIDSAGQETGIYCSVQIRIP